MTSLLFKISRLFCLAVVLGAFVSGNPAMAQRKITPVKPSTPATPAAPAQPKSDEFDRPANLAEMLDAEGNVVLVDTISGKEWVDSTAIRDESKKMRYPLFESVTFGVNIWDAAMRLFGQENGLGDAWVELSLHNRYKPLFEFGFGSADETPDGKNYTYKSKLAPFFRIGANYNVFYNNDPRYQLLVGVRYGFTPFSYEVTNVSVSNGYWDITDRFDIPSQSTTVGFFELAAGVRVMIARQISLGWLVKYHTILHEGKTDYGKPMYIPGYGKRGGNFGASFSISYTLPLNKVPIESVNKDKGKR